jgi:quercetin dioxygenase-like cupin family protein
MIGREMASVPGCRRGFRVVTVATVAWLLCGTQSYGQSSSLSPSAVSFFAGDRTFAGEALLVDRMASSHYSVFGVQRVGPGAVEYHAVDTDIVMVLDGSATFVTGGSITDEKERAPNERTGSGIAGGDAWVLTKGDIIVVPNGLPHWFKQVNGRIRYCAVKIRQAASTPSYPPTVQFFKDVEAFAKNGLVFTATEGRFASISALRRTQPLGVESHDVDTDVVFVLDGRGSFVTGGTIKEPRQLRENEGTGTSVEGGTAQPLDPGSVLVVPRGVPHWLREINGSLEFFAVKVR